MLVLGLYHGTAGLPRCGRPVVAGIARESGLGFHP